MKSGSRRSQTNAHVHNGAAVPKGLAAVEGYIRRHDDAMITDCDEDINALLILAGLFSTILTAFIAVSVGWFNEDYTQTTAQLLQQISLQLADRSSPVAQTPTFEATTVDVAINILWFLSLILSLAAALFGMIVKQWLREYSMWETEPPQDAIWLRQIRYKAFLEWKVPLIVALLPGLLEVALVLFLVGIIAMLWTLNSMLALIISVVSALLAMVAFSVIVIPAFFAHCPYRSPAGWACVVLWDAIARVFFRLLFLTGQASRATLRDRLNIHQDVEDWKERDLHIDAAGTSGHRVGSYYETNTSKLVHLVDALAWTYERCQNESILEDLHYSFGEPSTQTSHATRLQLPLYAMCRKFSIDPEVFLSSLHKQYIRQSSNEEFDTYTLRLLGRLDIMDPFSIPRGIVSAEIIGAMLLTEASNFASVLAHDEKASVTAWDITAFVDALCFLYDVSRMSPSSRVKVAYADFLVEFYRQTTRKDEEGTSDILRRFRTIVVQLLAKIGSIRLSGRGISVNLEHTHMTFRDYAQLAIQVFRENEGYKDLEGRHLFVTLSDIAIHKCDSWYSSLYHEEDLQTLLQCMEEATRVSLHFRIRNCGYYADMPWMISLSHAAATNQGLYNYIPLSFLRASEECLSADLTTGPAAKKQLEDLVAQCACHETVVIERTEPLPQGAMSPTADGKQAHDTAPVSLDADCGPSDSQSPEYDISDTSPLLGTPSSGTLAEATPNESAVTLSRKSRPSSPSGDD